MPMMDRPTGQSPSPDLDPAPPQRRAVIDVGTNSVKLLVADVRGTTVEPVFERGDQTRLGEGFFETRTLQPEPISRTAAAIAHFLRQARRHQAVSIRLIATAAAREALNPDDLTRAIRQHTDLPLEILSGSTEADLAFRGVCSTPHFPGGPVLVTDLGGGSTEFIVGRDSRRTFSRSFPLGAVRLLEALTPPPRPSPGDCQECRDMVDRFLSEQVVPEVRAAISGRDQARVHYLGVGGTAVTLARMALELPDFDRARIENTRLTSAEMTQWVERLWSLPIEERRGIAGLPPERADVILTGCVVYERILIAFNLDSFAVSTRGLRFAALLEPGLPLSASSPTTGPAV